MLRCVWDRFRRNIRLPRLCRSVCFEIGYSPIGFVRCGRAACRAAEQLDRRVRARHLALCQPVGVEIRRMRQPVGVLADVKAGVWLRRVVEEVEEVDEEDLDEVD